MHLSSAPTPYIFSMRPCPVTSRPGYPGCPNRMFTFTRGFVYCETLLAITPHREDFPPMGPEKEGRGGFKTACATRELTTLLQPPCHPCEHQTLMQLHHIAVWEGQRVISM